MSPCDIPPGLGAISSAALGALWALLGYCSLSFKSIGWHRGSHRRVYCCGTEMQPQGHSVRAMWRAARSWMGRHYPQA